MRVIRQSRLLWLFVIFVLGAFPVMAQVEATEEAETAYGNPNLLVDSDWVMSNSDNADVLIVDVREQADYDRGHLPQAVHIDLGSLEQTIDGIPAQAADAETAASVLGELGITPENTVVVYDDSDSLYAARMFWLLEYYGFTDVRLLDGGWTAWSAAELPTSTDAVERESVDDLSLTAHSALNVDVEWVEAHLDDPSVVLIDARSSAEHAGDAPNGSRPGRIPGAVNLDWHLNLENGVFVPPDAMAALYTDFDLDEAEQLVVYCTIGYRASVDYFALRLLGYENVAVYDGSWIEWSAREDLPIETGS